MKEEEFHKVITKNKHLFHEIIKKAIIEVYKNNLNPEYIKYLNMSLITDDFISSSRIFFNIYKWIHDYPEISKELAQGLLTNEYNAFDYVEDSDMYILWTSLLKDYFDELPFIEIEYNEEPNEVYEELFKIFYIKIIRGEIAKTTISLKPLNIPPYVIENILQQSYNVESTIGLYDTMNIIHKYYN